MNLRCILSFFTISFPIISFAQSITPHVMNNGGGYSSSIEWNLGESISVANFITSGYSLNTGVLQPMTSIVTAINEYDLSALGTQITIGPNPTSGVLHFKARFVEVGNLSIQLIDVKSTIVLNQEAGTIFSSYEKAISLDDYPSGVFYVKVFFKPIVGNIKTGIYKIIKL